MIFELLRSEIKFISVYTCAGCGKKQTGSTDRATLDAASSEDLKEQVDKLRQRSHAMPVGWGCYHQEQGDVFRCFRCLI